MKRWVGLWRTNGCKRQFCFLERILKMSVLAVPINQPFEVDKNKVKDFNNQSHNKKQWILDRLSKYNKNEITWD
jgi:hypothetical protein